MWDKATYTRELYLDTSIGRYLIRREHKGSRLFRVYLNGKRTSHSGTVEDCIKSVERVLKQANLK